VRRPGVRLACVRCKYTEQAQSLSIKMGDYERIVMISGSGKWPGNIDDLCYNDTVFRPM